MEHIFGVLTLIFSILLVFIALPSQIRKNKRDRKSGLTFWMVVIPLCMFSMRASYAVTIKAWYLVTPDFIGALLWVVILVQYFIYRKAKKSPSTLTR